MGEVRCRGRSPAREFIPGARREWAAGREDALAAAKAKDATIAERAQGASYAGEADPYRHDDEDGEDPRGED